MIVQLCLLVKLALKEIHLLAMAIARGDGEYAALQLTVMLEPGILSLVKGSGQQGLLRLLRNRCRSLRPAQVVRVHPRLIAESAALASRRVGAKHLGHGDAHCPVSPRQLGLDSAQGQDASPLPNESWMRPVAN